MKVGDLAKRPPVTLHVDATVGEVAAVMAAHNIGAVVIVDTEGRPLGIVTEKDLVRAMARGVPNTAKALEVGTSKDLLTAKPEDGVYQVLVAMRKRGVRHVILVDNTGKAVGVLSVRDFLEDPVLKELGESARWPKTQE
ncbi:MAG: CBS domain-containing protein [Pyrobaculum sp.]